MGKLFSKNKGPKHQHGKYDAGVPAEIHAGNGPVHSDSVVSLAKIQPGLCVSGSKDKTIVLYDYHNHRLEDRWTGHDREITKVCYGIHCRGVFSASRDKTVKLWHRGHASPIRDLLCSGSRDNTLKLWDVETGQFLRENKTSRNLVTDVKFVADSHLLVQTGEDKEVRLFDTRTMSITHNFPRKQYIQMCCDVSPDGNYCLTCSNGFGGNGCEATLWDLRSLQIIQEYHGHSEALESCIFLPSPGDRPLLATSSRDCSVRVWDQNSRACIAQCTISCSGPLTSLIAYEDNRSKRSKLNIWSGYIPFGVLGDCNH
ncbi:WDR31-like protein, partial [Mya arenaria]